MLKESDAGIIESVNNSLNKFRSSIKTNCNDFQVYEINLNNEVLEINKLENKEKSHETAQMKKYENSGLDIIKSSFNFTSDQISILKSKYFTDEDISNLRIFIQNLDKISSECIDLPYCLILGSSDVLSVKDLRTCLHQSIREILPCFLTATVVKSDLDKYLNPNDPIKLINLPNDNQTLEVQHLNSAVIVFPKKICLENINVKINYGKLSQNETAANIISKIILANSRDDERWPKNRPPYLHLKLIKYNRDTADAVQTITKCAGLTTKFATWAGTKDRRAITVQAVSIYKLSLEKLRNSIISSYWDKNVHVEFIGYQDYPLKNGDLKGNLFKICLRNIPKEDESYIEDNLNSLRLNGFINYFGLQRFGRQSISTYVIGLYLLKCKWKEAVYGIFGVNDDNTLDENNKKYNAIKIYLETNDPNLALTYLPKYLYIEKTLLKHLAKNQNESSFLPALQQLPKPSLSLYVHAVQSLIWNHIATYKWKTYGNQVCIGDIIYQKDNNQNSNILNTSKRRKCYYHEVKEITDNISIYDVVLPLIGTDVIIPTYLINEYENICKQYDVDVSSFFNLHKYNIGRFEGAYRKFIQKPTDLEYSIIHNVSENQILIPSYIDEYIIKEERDNVDNNKTSTCVVMSCKLQQSSYVTMALREVTNTY